MIDVRRLRVLRQVALTSSISEAASDLGYSPSAVSQQIAALERETSVPMLERRGRGIVLTRSARVLVKHADVLLAQLERAEAELAIEAGRLDGTVRLAAFATALRGVVPRALAELAVLAPDIAVRVSESEPDQALPALARHDLDVVVAYEYDLVAGPRVGGLHRRELLVDPMVLVGPETQSHQGCIAIDALADARWLLPPEQTYCGQLVRRACEAAGFRPEPVGTSQDFGALVAMAAGGLGTALVPTLALTPEALRTAVAPHPQLARRLFAAVRDGAQEHPVVGAMLTALGSTASTPAGSVA
jgi:molybdate transport repressor ModE-like protein